MAFVFYLTLSTFILYLLTRVERKVSYFLIFFFVVAWVIFVGGQYDVGTDYFSYMSKFVYLDSAKFAFRNEYVFLTIISISKKIWNNPQATFFFLSLISVVFMILFWKNSMDKRDWWIYFFLMVTFSTAFNNQFNAVRQYLAIFTLSFAFIELSWKKYWLAILLFTMGVGIHKSGVLFVVLATLVYIISKREISNRLFYVLLLVCALVPLFSNSFLKFIPLLVERITTLDFLTYETYLQGKEDYITEISRINIYSKIIFLPFYFSAIHLRKRLVYSELENLLLSSGLFFYSLKLICLISTITNRFSMYFELLMIFPILYLVRYLIVKKSMSSFFVILFFFLSYMLKVVFFPKGEYIYDSIFFYMI